jgi:hypothetical protein
MKEEGMRGTRTAIALVVVLIGALVGASVAVAQVPPPPPTPAPAGSTIDAEPETQTHVVTTGAVVVATVRDAAGEPLANVQVFWTETGEGEIVEADSATDENGEAEAVLTSRTASPEGPPPVASTVTASLDAMPAGSCPETPANPRCDNVKIIWVKKQNKNQPALECSGGAYGAQIDPPLGRFGEVEPLEEPCPEEGTPSEPKVRRVSEVDVPASPVLFVALAEGRSEFTSTSSESTGRVVGAEVGGTLGVEVAGARATSRCSANGIATQELDGGQVVITDTMGTPDDPSDDEIIFSGIAPANTEIPLDPLINIRLNEQNPGFPDVEGGFVGPELPGEKQNRHAEGSVNAVHIQIGPDPDGGPAAIDIVLGHAESDITCKQHAFAIDLEPETQTADVGSQATTTATVTDEAGRPVVGAPVTWEETGEGTFVSTEETTDQNGQADAVTTSSTPGTQTVTASISTTTTKCSVAAGGICSDSVTIIWEDGGPTPGNEFIIQGHAHTDYDGDGRVHVTKNDRGDVHVGANLRDTDVTDNTPPRGRLGYWDLRPNPPGAMRFPFRCEHFQVETLRRLNRPEVVVQMDGTVGRCNKAQTDPAFRRFRMFIRDNGPNPPNFDGYHMIFFDANGNVIYDWEDATTVGLGDLRIQQV